MPRSGPGPTTARPCTRISRASPRMKPPRTCSKVLLPHPLGPTTVTNSPSATDRRARSSTSSVRPSRAYVLRSPTTSSAGVLISGGLGGARRPGQQPLERGARQFGRPALAADAPVPEPARERAGELALFADLARQADDRLDSRPPARDVARQRRRRVRLAPGGPRQLAGEDGGVFHRHARALAHVRRQRVRRVAQERDAAASPGGLMHFLDVGAHDAVDRLEPAECLPHSRIGELAEHGLQRLHALEPPRAALARRVEGGPDVELAAADRHEADALAVAEELGEMLEAVAVLHDEAVGPIA